MASGRKSKTELAEEAARLVRQFSGPVQQVAPMPFNGERLRTGKLVEIETLLRDGKPYATAFHVALTAQGEDQAETVRILANQSKTGDRLPEVGKDYSWRFRANRSFNYNTVPFKLLAAPKPLQTRARPSATP